MEQGLGEESLAAGTAPERPQTLSLVDRFPRVLDAGRRIASALTREAVFEAVRQSMLELLRPEHCVVLDPSQVLSEEMRAAEGVSRTAIARALETGQPAILSQGMHGGVSESMEMIGVRSLLCAPLQVRGKTVACVCASHRQVGELFGEDEERLAGFITTLASVALENAEGFERMKALSEERGRLYREEQEAVRRRDDFLSIAAHELKTPLTSLQLHLQGLMTRMRQTTEALPPERVATKLESANQQTQRLGKLVNELLDISRVAQGQLLGKLEEVDLVALVRGVIERSREALARAECPVELQATSTVVGRWDAMRMEQVVGNLLTNAMKYGAGKRISDPHRGRCHPCPAPGGRPRHWHRARGHRPHLRALRARGLRAPLRRIRHRTVAGAGDRPGARGHGAGGEHPERGLHLHRDPAAEWPGARAARRRPAQRRVSSR